MRIHNSVTYVVHHTTVANGWVLAPLCRLDAVTAVDQWRRIATTAVVDQNSRYVDAISENGSSTVRQNTEWDRVDSETRSAWPACAIHCATVPAARSQHGRDDHWNFNDSIYLAFITVWVRQRTSIDDVTRHWWWLKNPDLANGTAHCSCV